MARLRASLLAEVSHAPHAVVLDLGAGTGPNLAHLPPTVERVLAVEPERHLRALLQAQAHGAGVPVEVVDAVAEDLPFDDGTVDVAIATHVLCSVHDPRRALDELHRVLRRGGRLFVIEHVRGGPAAAALQRMFDLGWRHVAGGCHTARDTESTIIAAGFTFTRRARVRFPAGPVPTPVSPHVVGVAVS